MAYVVTRLCQGCKDTVCMTVCPVDCFYEPKEPSSDLPDMLYIHPEDCIDCDACLPECPWDAIYVDDDVPDVFKDDIALNAKSEHEPDLFKMAENIEKDKPSPDESQANKMKWGLEA